MTSLASFIASIKGDVVLPDDPTYPAAIARWATNAERKAKLVVFVKSAEDVAATIKYAREHKLPFAVRGGAHNTAGSSSAEGGVVADLSRHLNHVEVDEAARTGRVGGGALWRDVDAAAIKYGLATVGGTVNHTGVGGLSVGGGYGWLMGRHGLTVDNVLKATVVTADSRILTASADENPDLFWGIRGGGSNFGVVTEFVFRLFPQRRTIFAGPLVYSADKVAQVVEATSKWWASVGPDEGSIQAATTDKGVPVYVCIIFFNGSEAEGRERFKAFYDIGPMVDGAKDRPYEELNGLQNPDLYHGRSYYVSGTAQHDSNPEVTLALMKQVAEIDAAGVFWPAVIHEFLSVEKVNTVASDVTPFRRQLTSNVLVVLAWDGAPEKTAEAREIAHGIKRRVNAGQSVANADYIGYTNYDMDASTTEVNIPNFDAKARQGFGSNYPRLQQIKKKYDPELFFNRWFPIAPAA